MRFNTEEFPHNPNTKSFWDYYYGKRVVERKNKWLFPSVINSMTKTAQDRTTFKFLEIGCGAGRTIFELKKLFCIRQLKDILWVGVDYSGVGIRKAMKKYGTSAVKFYISDIEKKETLPNDKFDFILCSETLEHLNDPPTACRNMKSLLVPNGKIFLTVPVFDSPLDKNPNNLHAVSYIKSDFRRFFSDENVEIWEIDKQHLAVEITKK